MVVYIHVNTCMDISIFIYVCVGTLLTLLVFNKQNLVVNDFCKIKCCREGFESLANFLVWKKKDWKKLNQLPTVKI